MYLDKRYDERTNSKQSGRTAFELYKNVNTNFKSVVLKLTFLISSHFELSKLFILTGLIYRENQIISVTQNKSGKIKIC